MNSRKKNKEEIITVQVDEELYRMLEEVASGYNMTVDDYASTIISNAMKDGSLEDFLRGVDDN